MSTHFVQNEKGDVLFLQWLFFLNECFWNHCCWATKKIQLCWLAQTVEQVYKISLNNSILNYHWVKEGIRRTIKNFIEFNGSESTIFPNSQDTMEVVLRGTLIALCTHIKQLENSRTSSLTGYLKALEKEQTHPREVDSRK